MTFYVALKKKDLILGQLSSNVNLDQDQGIKLSTEQLSMQNHLEAAVAFNSEDPLSTTLFWH